LFVSAIDNLVKGAAGQAIQNMNISLRIPGARGARDDCPVSLKLLRVRHIFFKRGGKTLSGHQIEGPDSKTAVSRQLHAE
jgi:hypothetical protein